MKKNILATLDDLRKQAETRMAEEAYEEAMWSGGFMAALRMVENLLREEEEEKESL